MTIRQILFLITMCSLLLLGPEAYATSALKVLERNQTTVQLSYQLGQLTLSKSFVAGQQVTTVHLADALPCQQWGMPELPTLTSSVAIAAQGTPSVRIIDRQEREIEVGLVLPSLGQVDRNVDPATLQPVFGAVYQGGTIFPQNVVELGRPFVLGDRRGVNLRLNPVRWDASRGVLLVIESITVEITTSGTGGVNVLPKSSPASSQAFRTLHEQVFQDLKAAPFQNKSDKYSAPAAQGRMLIISHDDFAPALVPFRHWKAQRGIATELVLMSETDGTAAGLRQLITKKYLTSAGLTWVVLVGDKAQVPTNVGTYDGSDADSPYAMIIGDDLYPELFVSRISASTIAQVETQVAKFINYERHPDTGLEAQWYSRGAGVASDEGSPADFERAELLRTELLSQNYAAVDRIYQGLGASTSAISAAVNEGCSLVNYLGHGSGLSWDSVAFNTNDVAQLQNDNRLPWIIDVSCFNGDFALETSFAEAWLRAGTAENPAGAVGMIAASSLAPWTPPTVMQSEVVNLLTSGACHTLGALYYSGLMKVLDEYSGIPVATQVMEQNIVFGDASLQVRTKAPAFFDISLPLSVEEAATSLTVQVANATRGTISISYADQVLGVAEITQAGNVRVAISSPLFELNSVVVTVTGPDMVPFESEVAVVLGTSPVFDSVLPSQPILRGNFPNPFNPITQIVFELPTAQLVSLSVFDVRGNLIKNLVDGMTGEGRHEINWRGDNNAGQQVSSGLYFYRLISQGEAETGRMVLAK